MRLRANSPGGKPIKPGRESKTTVESTTHTNSRGEPDKQPTIGTREQRVTPGSRGARKGSKASRGVNELDVNTEAHSQTALTLTSLIWFSMWSRQDSCRFAAACIAFKQCALLVHFVFSSSIEVMPVEHYGVIVCLCALVACV